MSWNPVASINSAFKGNKNNQMLYKHQEKMEYNYQHTEFTALQTNNQSIQELSHTSVELSIHKDKIAVMEEKSKESVFVEAEKFHLDIQVTHFSYTSNQETTDAAPSSQDFAERIVGFARMLAKDNPEKADLLENAYEKGFQKAKEELGGWLPERCYDTFEIVKDLFDDWRTEEA